MNCYSAVCLPIGHSYTVFFFQFGSYWACLGYIYSGFEQAHLVTAQFVHHCYSVSPLYFSYFSKQPSTLTQGLGRGLVKESGTDQWPLRSCNSGGSVPNHSKSISFYDKGKFPGQHCASEAGYI